MSTAIPKWEPGDRVHLKQDKTRKPTLWEVTEVLDTGTIRICKPGRPKSMYACMWTTATMLTKATTDHAGDPTP